MKAFTILATFLTVAAAVNPFAARADCSCDISKCPSGPANCKCVTGLLDACYVAQTNAGIDCGKPVYPSGCSSSTFPIQDQACGGSTGGSCKSDQICFVPDRSCDIHTGNCTGLCASDYCGGDHDKLCPDARWSCVYDDRVSRLGRLNATGSAY
ncbi:hypothetical protein FB567DRAFT_596129 [Paraphoma chrysanthemicola]|uniref:Uncharacterized protein n=1 Tax=Paraphoma chrysanthemicola TaxID=798071 RepID=A0A8K0VVK8_9PLEO|nr:hypothetical protein FB567DRAFT_596129 [Paraphoma chrysanthemicola]